MLLEMALADAYAIAWEFTDEQQGKNDLSAFYQHPTYAELLPGQYTDDTQRAIANAEVLISGNLSDAFNPLAYGNSYVHAFKRDPREGYSRGFQALLKGVHSGWELLRDVKRTKASNGSVMGVAPLGFIHDIPSLKMAATIQALTTHHSSTAVHAQIVALAAHFFIHVKETRDQLLEFVMDNVDWLDKSHESNLWLGEMAGYAYDPGKKTGIKAQSISAYVVHILSNQNVETLNEIIYDAVDRGGDTDSAAASAVAIASMSSEIQNDLPENLYNDLDEANPVFGCEFLINLENDLKAI